MRYLLFVLLIETGLDSPAKAQHSQLGVAAYPIAIRYQLPTADCALFPAAASIGFGIHKKLPRARRFTPTHQQVVSAERALANVDLATVNIKPESAHYANYPFLIKSRLIKYRRQYAGFYNRQNHPCLFINLFDKEVHELIFHERSQKLPGVVDPVPDWLIYFFEVSHGGYAYWSIYYDLTTRKFYNFQHNIDNRE